MADLFPGIQSMQEARHRFFTLRGNFDPQVAQLSIFLWPKHAQQDGTGALARWLRAQVSSSELDIATEQWKQVLVVPEYAPFATWCLSRPPFDAYTKWPNITTMRAMTAHKGPTVTSAQFDAALADFTANHTPVNPVTNFISGDISSKIL